MRQKKWQKKNKTQRDQKTKPSSNSKKNIGFISILRDKKISLGLLIGITVICLAPIFNCDFVNFDDHRIILDNKYINGGKSVSIIEILTAWMYSAHYKPITFLSWNMEYRLFGFEPFVFHFNNLLLHLANTFFIFQIIRISSGYFKCSDTNSNLIAFFAALFFAIHPMHVESVAWATERKDVLYSFFFLGGILSYLLYIKTNSIKWIILAAICYPFSMFSKSTGITLIAILPLLDYMAGRNLFSKKVIIEKIPFLILLLGGMYFFGLLDNFYGQASGLTTHVVEYEHVRFESDPVNLTGMGGLYESWLLLNYKLTAWTLHIFFPFKLSVVYPRKSFIEFIGWGIHLLPLLNLLIAGIVLYTLRKSKFIFICCLFYLITILPALSVPDNGNGTFLSDRYTYIPSIGIILLIVGFFIVKLKKEKLKINLLLAITALYGILCFLQTKTWKDSISLWTHTIKHYPSFSIPYSNRGVAYCELGQLDKGMVDLKKAVAFSPSDYSSHHNIGNIMAQNKQFAQALEEFTTALKYKPNAPEIYKARGDTHYFMGNQNLALQDYNQAIELNSTGSKVFQNRGAIYLNSGDYAKALDDFGRAIEIDPLAATAYINRAKTYLNLGNKEMALKDAAQAQKLGAKVNQGVP